MVKPNQRKNRAKKKEVPQRKWNDDLRNLKDQYAYGGKKRGEENENSEEERQHS